MTKRITAITLGITAATLGIGGIAYAQLPAKADRMAAHKAMMDPDGDGIVTRAEAQAASAQMFVRMDVNKDGKIDSADRKARRAEMRGKMFERLDADNNGAISEAEFTNARRHEGRMGEKAGEGPGMERGGEGHGGRHFGKRGHRGGGMMGMMKNSDTDGDGAISQAEFTAAATKHFAMVDTNSDGRITAEEREAAHAKMKERFEARRAEHKAQDSND